jgi:hypothetical protein
MRGKRRKRPDDSKWFLTDRPLNVLQLVAGLRRHPNLKALLSRTAREWLRHRGLKPGSLPVPTVEGRRLPGHAGAPLAPEELLDFLGPHRKARVEDFLEQLAQTWRVFEKRSKVRKGEPPG